MVSRGAGLGLTATSGRFLGFLELEIKHKVTGGFNTLDPGSLVGVALLEEVCHCRGGFEALLLAAQKTAVFSCLPLEQDVELSAHPACLDAAMFWSLDDNGLNL